MALVKCHECENEISTKAKVCPQCGAKNNNREKTGLSKWVAIAAVIIVGYIIYYLYEHELNPNIPTCESSHGRKVFENTFDKSPYAQQNKLRILDVTDQREVSAGSNPEDRVCEVTFRLNNGTNEIYIVTFESKESGGYFVRLIPK